MPKQQQQQQRQPNPAPRWMPPTCIATAAPSQMGWQRMQPIVQTLTERRTLASRQLCRFQWSRCVRRLQLHNLQAAVPLYDVDSDATRVELPRLKRLQHVSTRDAEDNDAR
jgi:hypothetical protein